jgi:hypothetical protein
MLILVLIVVGVILSGLMWLISAYADATYGAPPIPLSEWGAITLVALVCGCAAIVLATRGRK